MPPMHEVQVDQLLPSSILWHALSQITHSMRNECQSVILSTCGKGRCASPSNLKSGTMHIRLVASVDLPSGTGAAGRYCKAEKPTSTAGPSQLEADVDRYNDPIIVY